MIYQIKQTAVVDAAGEPVTLNDARLHVRIITDPQDASAHPDDGLVAGFIASARGLAEGKLGRRIGARSFDLMLDAFPCASSFVLPLSPVTEITEIAYSDAGGTQQILLPASYHLDTGGLVQRLSLMPGASWPSTQARAQAVRISLKAGWSAADVPAPVKQWMLLQIGTWYDNRESVVVSDDEPAAMPFVDGLLDPYRVILF